MYRNLSTKIVPALALSFVVLATSIEAADPVQPKKAQMQPQKSTATMGMVNPPANPPAQNGVGLWVQAEALYLKASGNLPFAIESPFYSLDDPSAPSHDHMVDTVLNGPVRGINYQWDWGCRAGIGYNLPHDGWDIVANWTYFNTSHTKSITAGTDKFLFSTVEKTLPLSREDTSNISNSTYVTGTNTTAKTHLHLNLLDLGMGREFFVSKYMTVRPHVGARAAWLNSKLSTKLGGNLSSSRATLDENYYILAANQLLKDKFTNKFNGGGLFGGLDAEWGLGSGMSFYSQLDFALLYGTQTSTSLETLDTTSETSEVSILRLNDSYKRTQTRPMTDLAFGLRWEMPFSNDAYRIRLQLGWEQHIIFNFIQTLVMESNLMNQKEDLSLTGFSFQGRFDF